MKEIQQLTTSFTEDDISGNVSGINFEFEITLPPNYQKTIGANFWDEKVD